MKVGHLMFALVLSIMFSVGIGMAKAGQEAANEFGSKLKPAAITKIEKALQEAGA